MSGNMLDLEQNTEYLSSEYTLFSQIHRGCANILAGSISVLIFFVNWQLGPSILTAGLTIALTLIWLIGKEVIWRWCYNKAFADGKDITTRIFLYWRIGTGILLSLATADLWAASIFDGSSRNISSLIALLIMTALPALVFLSLRSPIELLSGIMLLVACAAASVGQLSGYVHNHPDTFLLMGFYLILMGAFEDRYYGYLEKLHEEV